MITTKNFFQSVLAYPTSYKGPVTSHRPTTPTFPHGRPISALGGGKSQQKTCKTLTSEEGDCDMAPPYTNGKWKTKMIAYPA